MDNYFTVLYGIVIIGLIILGWMVYLNPNMTNKTKKAFINGIRVVIIVISAQIVNEWLKATGAQYQAARLIATVIEISLAPIIPILLGYGICDLMPLSFKILTLPGAINFLLTFLSIKFGLVFFINPENFGQPGPLYGVFALSTITGHAFLFLKTINSVRYYENKSRYVLYLIFGFITLGYLIEFNNPQFRTAMLCVSMAIIMYYAYYIELDQRLDTMTSLFNRKMYDIEISKLNKTMDLTILLLDVDELSDVNNRNGHKYGDYCLNEIASCIKDAFSCNGQCYRIGGDEFCVLSKQNEDPKIRSSIRYFHNKIEANRRKDNRFPTVSVGYAYYDHYTQEITDAINMADEDMYRNKEKRKIANNQKNVK